MVSPGLETSTLLSSIYTPSSSLTITTKEGEDGSIGSNKFMVAYCINLERLCIQAHWTAGLIGREKSTSVNISSNVSSIGVSGDSIGGGDGSSHNQYAATPGLDNVLSSLMTGGSSCNNNNNTNNEEEEYIVQAFLDDTDKIECLVKTLLLLELWREHVLFPNNKNKQQCSDNNDNAKGVDDAIEEEVEFEIEGGERDEDEYYNELNDVDGGGNNENNNNANAGATNKNIKEESRREGPEQVVVVINPSSSSSSDHHQQQQASLDEKLAALKRYLTEYIVNPDSTTTRSSATGYTKHRAIIFCSNDTSGRIVFELIRQGGLATLQSKNTVLALESADNTNVYNKIDEFKLESRNFVGGGSCNILVVEDDSGKL